MRAFLRTLQAARRHDLLWLLSQHPARLLAARIGKLLFGTRIIVDTGDLIYESLKTAGSNALFCQLVNIYEKLSLYIPDAMVVRGNYHIELLQRAGVRKTLFIPDGVECDQFARVDGDAIRARINAGNAVVIGIMSSISWEPHLKIPSPGWDIVECLARLPDLNIIGLVVGDGAGLAKLKELAEQRGVADRMRWVGRISYQELPAFLSAIDIFLHTALNNPMSQVRTTGKLPLLLASGCAAVVAAVGEARRVLADTDMLLDFDDGLSDYADRLAIKVKNLIAERKLEKWRESGPVIAKREFDYQLLSKRAQTLLRELAK
jgi:glycosyltransferase involved in cell wall biosynthesis